MKPKMQLMEKTQPSSFIPIEIPQLHESPASVGEHDFLQLSEMVQKIVTAPRLTKGTAKRLASAWRYWREEWILHHGQLALLTAAQVGRGKSVLGVVPQWEMRYPRLEMPSTITLVWRNWVIALEVRHLPTLGSEPVRVSGWIVYYWSVETDSEIGVVGQRLVEFAQCGELSAAIAQATGGYVTQSLMQQCGSKMEQ